MDQRGIVRNKLFASQVKDYSGMRWGNITPTDIDGCMEYKNKGYVFIETKYGAAELPYGQRLALERLCDDLQKVKPTILMVTSHTSESDIDMAETEVTEYRYKGRWKLPSQSRTAKELADMFVAHLEEFAGEQG